MKDPGRKFSLSADTLWLSPWHWVDIGLHEDHGLSTHVREGKPGRTMQQRSHGGRGMVRNSLGYLFFDWQFCSFVGIRFPDSLLALILSGPWQSSPRLILGHLPISIYVPFFLEAVSTPGLDNGFNTGVSQFTFAAWCLSCSPFHVVRCLRMTHFDDPSLAKTPLPGLKTQNSSSLPPLTPFPWWAPFSIYPYFLLGSHIYFSC